MKNYLKKAFAKSHVVVGVILSALLTSVVLYAATVVKPNEFVSGQVISAAEVNENFDVLYTEVNKIVNKNGFAISFPASQSFTVISSNYQNFEPDVTVLYNDGSFNESNCTYTVPISGIYRLTENVTFTGMAMVNIRRYLNSTQYATIGKLNAGDVIRWDIGSNSESGTATINNTTSHIYLERLF